MNLFIKLRSNPLLGVLGVLGLLISQGAQAADDWCLQHFLPGKPCGDEPGKCVYNTTGNAKERKGGFVSDSVLREEKSSFFFGKKAAFISADSAVCGKGKLGPHVKVIGSAIYGTDFSIQGFVTLEKSKLAGKFALTGPSEVYLEEQALKVSDSRLFSEPGNGPGIDISGWTQISGSQLQHQVTIQGPPISWEDSHLSPLTVKDSRVSGEKGEVLLKNYVQIIGATVASTKPNSRTRIENDVTVRGATVQDATLRDRVSLHDEAGIYGGTFFGDGMVSDQAKIYGGTFKGSYSIGGKTRIDQAEVFGERPYRDYNEYIRLKILGNAHITGGKFEGYADIGGDASIEGGHFKDRTRVEGHAKILDGLFLDDSSISGNTQISGGTVKGQSKIEGQVILTSGTVKNSNLAGQVQVQGGLVENSTLAGNEVIERTDVYRNGKKEVGLTEYSPVFKSQHHLSQQNAEITDSETQPDPKLSLTQKIRDALKKGNPSAANRLLIQAGCLQTDKSLENIALQVQGIIHSIQPHCSICLVDFKDCTEEITLTGCGHPLCNTCFETNRAQNGDRCPICKETSSSQNGLLIKKGTSSSKIDFQN